jgi:hypothetical protein
MCNGAQTHDFYPLKSVRGAIALYLQVGNLYEGVENALGQVCANRIIEK